MLDAQGDLQVTFYSIRLKAYFLMTLLNNTRRSEAPVLMCAQVDHRLHCVLTGSGLILPCNSIYWIEL